ncbi:hypothetical protein [Methylotenera sp.]|uniref:type IV pilus modification PilV family protein n=1 Tax=Methylotenera sp. TaxID=2051956 RepID=UPI00248831B8|nr:hypothetical protein [Methylotenera sp.]MDI1360749.1 hypothetical protein [Methylotenera sp.]
MNNKYNNLRKNNSGSVLLEVLISILLFAFGVLGLVGMQSISTQNSMSSQDRAVASILANDMVSQMWARNISRQANLTVDIAAWQTRVQNSILPNANGNVADVNGLATITITWRSPSKAATENDNRYETTVFVN